MSRPPPPEALRRAVVRLSQQIGVARAAACLDVSAGEVTRWRKAAGVRAHRGRRAEEDLKSECAWCGDDLLAPGFCRPPKSCRDEYLADAAKEKK